MKTLFITGIRLSSYTNMHGVHNSKKKNTIYFQQRLRFIKCNGGEEMNRRTTPLNILFLYDSENEGNNKNK